MKSNHNTKHKNCFIAVFSEAKKVSIGSFVVFWDFLVSILSQVVLQNYTCDFCKTMHQQNQNSIYFEMTCFFAFNPIALKMAKMEFWPF